MQPDACLNRYLVAPCFMHFGLLACFHFEIASSAAFDIYIFLQLAVVINSILAPQPSVE